MLRESQRLELAQINIQVVGYGSAAEEVLLVFHHNEQASPGIGRCARPAGGGRVAVAPWDDPVDLRACGSNRSGAASLAQGTT